MNHTYPPEQYVELLNAYMELEQIAFSPSDNRKTVLTKLRQRSDQRCSIASQVNTMISECVGPYLKAPETMDASDVEALEAFLTVLLPSGNPFGLDVPISYAVSKLLLDYYRTFGDNLRYAQTLYRCTTQKMALGAYHMDYRYPGSPYLEECLALAERFRELPKEAIVPSLRALAMSTISQSNFDYPLYWRVDDILHALWATNPRRHSMKFWSSTIRTF